MMRNLRARARFPQASARPILPDPEPPISSHVAFIVNNYPPHVGGVERHVASLAGRLVDAGHDVTVVTLGPAEGDAIEDGVRVIRLRGRFSVGDVVSFPAPGSAARIARRLRDTGVTAVSIHTRFFPMSTVGLAVGQRLDVPVVHTEHGSDFVRGVNLFVGLASRVVDLTVGRRVLRRSDAVLAVSRQVAAFVARLAGVRASVFPNAIDLEVWRAAARPPRRRLVYVGRIVPGKGWLEVIRAAAILHERGIPFELGLYGDGPEVDILRQELDRSGLQGVATHHGQVDPTTLAEGVAGAILVNPTTLAEGFQTSLIEVVAAGGRAVTYEVAGADVLAADGAPVRIVPLGVDHLTEAIAAELEQPGLPYDPDRVAKWGWAARVSDYLRVIAEVGDRRTTEA